MRYHLYNLNINDEFRSGIYCNSVQVFLGGFVGEAKKYADVTLYGRSKSRSSSYFARFFLFVWERFFIFHAVFNRVGCVRELRSAHVFVVLGYDLVNVFQLLFLRAFGFKVICYIFDSHKLSVSGSGVKGFLVRKYYDLGFFFARWLNAVVCVNEAFPNVYGQNFKNIIKSKVGYSERYKECSALDESDGLPDCLKVVFGGTLNIDNGCQVILDLVRKRFPFDVQFILYGSGPFSGDFSRLSNELEFVEFLGEINNAEVLEVVRGANVCLNLRDPESVNKNLAFPSKLIEYLFNNNYLISNSFPALDSRLKRSFVGVCEFSADSLYDELVAFYERFDKMECFRVVGFVEDSRCEYSWGTVFSRFHDDVCVLFSRSLFS